MAKDLLIEIGLEEVPASFMPPVLKQWQQLAQQSLTDLRLEYGEIYTAGTPRRLTLIIRDLAEEQASRTTENRGPSVAIAFDAEGKPTKAAQGFARGQKVAPEQLVVRDGYVYAVVEETGKPVLQQLPELIDEWIQKLYFPKTMRWGDMDFRFVRPIRWFLALFGGEIIPMQLADQPAGRLTYGHRFLGKGAVEVHSVGQYLEVLAQQFVVLDPQKRKEQIVEQVRELAAQNAGEAVLAPELLEEVVYLVEYPTALCGHFAKDYLTLPAEAIITPMKEHQRYFPVKNEKGELLPLFITVRNGGTEHLELVRHGNERVLKARLDDARFFFEEDQKTPLSARVEKLKQVVFQENLGTMYDKTLRLENFCRIAGQALAVSQEQLAQAIKAAHLCKADLVTGMVGEFAELQGIMGREYALLEGAETVVAEAIDQHYRPRYAGDSLPGSLPGRMVSLADKLDNLTGTFSRGLIPTGSQDPFALRRQALGVANILIDADLDLDLRQLLRWSMDLLPNVATISKEELLIQLVDFFRQRLRVLLLDQGIRHDRVEAVLAGETFSVCRIFKQAHALQSADEKLPPVVRAFSRASNLAQKALSREVVPELLAETEEKELWEASCQTEKKLQALGQRPDYGQVFIILSGLVQPIDRFFDKVMVMDKDEKVRNNRLALLAHLVKQGKVLVDFHLLND